MLDGSWEAHATTLANAPTTEAFLEAVSTLIRNSQIDLSKPAHVVYARDTRPSGEELVRALEDGLKAAGAEGRDAGVTTTPVLHYLVRAINTKGTADAYGEDTQEGYYKKLGDAFKELVQGRPPLDPIIIDCANGVGAIAAEAMSSILANTLVFDLHNTSIDKEDLLNNSCGADFVKTQQKTPPQLVDVLKPNQRACSFDGDADRLMYFYHDENGQFRMLDGDKIAGLVAAFIVDLVKTAGLADEISVGVVQTAYANGASTKYLSDVSSVRPSIFPTPQLTLPSLSSASPSNAYPLASNTSTTPPSVSPSASTSKQTDTAPSSSPPPPSPPSPPTNPPHPPKTAHTSTSSL